MLNRNAANIAALTFATQSSERKKRTRTLIQLGGLVDLSGIMDTCNITHGENLQEDAYVDGKAAILLGMLMAANESLVQQNTHDQAVQKQIFKRRGITLLKQSTAKNVY